MIARSELVHMCCVLFFKQKTAYEMRISDWNSDVCSSDLSPQAVAFTQKWVDLAKSAGPTSWTSYEYPDCTRDLGDGVAMMVYDAEIGRASCRERVCQYVSISVVAASLTHTSRSNISHSRTHHLNTTT